jgi:hypothetical protein
VKRLSTVPEVTVKRHGKKKHMKTATKNETYIITAITDSGTAILFLALFPMWQE